MRKAVILTTLLLLLAASAHAAIRTWSGNIDSDWDNPLNWDNLPGPGDDIFIQTGRPNYPSIGVDGSYVSLSIETAASVTMTGNLTFSGSITITGTGVLNIGVNTLSAGSISGTGTLNGNTGTVNVSGNLSVATYNATTGTTTITSGDLVVTTFNHLNGTVIFAGATPNSTNAYTFGNLTVNKAGNTLTTGTGTITVNAALNVSAGTLGLNTNNTALTVNGATTVDGTLTAGSGNLILNGAVDGGGTLTASSGTSSFAGNLTVATFVHNDGTVVFTGALDPQSIGAFTYWNVTLSKGGAALRVRLTGATTITNTLTITTGTLQLFGNTLNLNSPLTMASANGTLNLGAAGTLNAGANTVTVNAGTIQVSTGTLQAGGLALGGGTYTATGAATVTLGASGLSMTSGTITANATNFSTSGNVTITGGTFNENTSTLQMTGAGTTVRVTPARRLYNFSAAPGAGNTVSINTDALSVAGTLTLTNGTLAAGALGISVAGDLVRTGGALTSSGTLTFNGTAAQTVDLSSSTLNNLTVANAAGVTLGAAASVGGTLTINAGCTLSKSTFALGVTGSVSAAGTLNMGGADTLTVGGDFSLGTLANAAGSTLVLNGGGAQAITPNTQTFGTVQKTGAGTTTLLGTATFASLSVTGGTFTLGGATATSLTVNGNLANSATFNLNSTAAAGTVLLSMAGGTTINNTGGTFRVLSSTGIVTILSPGTTTLLGNEIDLNSRTLRISGFSTAVAHMLDGAGDSLVLTGAATFSDGLTLNAAGSQVQVGAQTLTVTGLTVTTGTVTVSTGSIAAGASAVNTGAGGAVTFSGAGSMTSGAVTNAGAITLAGGTASTGAVNNTGTITLGTAAGASWTVAGNFTSSGTVTNTVVNSITVAGNVSVSGTFGGPTTNSTITLTGAGRTINTAVPIGNLATSGAGTTVTVVTNALNLAGTLTVATGTSLTDEPNDRGISVAQATTITGTGTLTLGDGTYTFAAVGGTGTFNDSATSTQTTVGGNLTITTFNHNGGTLRLAGGTTGAYTFNNVVIAGAVTSSGPWTIGGNLTISAGAWTAGANTHQVAGNWTNSVGVAGFVNAGSTIQFTGAVIHAISGATNFNNLTNTVAGSTLTFTSGQSFGVAGTLTLTGASANLITIQSSAAATFTLNNTVAQTVSFVRVSNSVAGATGITASNSIALTDNNTNWNFGAISWTGATNTNANLASNWATGVTPGQYDSAMVPIVTNQPVQTAAMSLRGLTVQAGASWSNGGQNLTISTSLSNSGTLTYTGAGTLSLGGGITTVGGTFVYSGGAVDLHPQLSTYNNLTVSGGTITAAVSGRTVSGTTSVTGGTFVIPVAVAFNSGTVFSVGAAGTLQTSGTINAAGFTSAGSITNSGLNAINASASVSISGAFGTPANNTLTMTGNGATLDSVPTLGSLAVNSAGTVTNNAALTLAGNLALTAGTFALGTTDLSVAGNVTRGAGSISSTGTTGTITLNGSAAQGVNFTASTIPNLTVSNTAGVILTNTAAFTWNGDCVVSAAGASLALANVPGQTIGGNVRGPGTLDADAIAGANTLTVTGYMGTNGVPLGTLLAPTASTVNVGTDWNVTTFTSGNGTVAFTGTGDLYSGTAFFNLNKTTGGTTTLNLDVTATNTAMVSAGVLAMGIHKLGVTGSLTISGGSLTHGNGALTCASLTVNGGTYDGTGAGSLTVTGPITASSGSINLGGKTVIDVTNLSVTGGADSDFGTATVTATGDLIFTSTGAHTAGTSVITLMGGVGTISVGTVGLTGTVILSGARTLTGAGAAADIEYLRIGAGSLTVNTGLALGVGTLEFAGAGSLTANGTATVTAGAGGILWSGASTGGITMGNGALTVNGPFTQTAGAFGAVSVGAGGMTVTGAVTNYGTITVTSGNLSAPGAAANSNYGTIQTATGGTQSYSGSLTNYGTLTGVGLVTLASITTPGAGARTVNVGTGGLLVTGMADFSGGTINGAAVGDPNWDFQGNLIFTADSTVNPVGDVLRFSAGNAQTFTTGGLTTFGPISVAKTAATTVTTSGSLTATSLAASSGTFAVATATTATFTGAVSITDILSLLGTATLEVGANLTLGTLTAAAGSTVRLNGAAAQVLTPNAQTFGAVSMTGTGGVSMVGTATFGSLSIALGETFTLGGAAATNLTTTGALANAGTLAFQSTAAVPAVLSLGANSSNPGTLTLGASNAAGTATLSMATGTTLNNAGGTIRVSASAGAVTLSSPGTFTLTGNQLDLNGLTLHVSGFSTAVLHTLDPSDVLILDGTATFSGGLTLDGAGTQVQAGAQTLNATGGLAVTNGSITATTGRINTGASALNLAAGGSITFMGAGSPSLSSGDVTNDGAITLAGGTATTGAVTNTGTVTFGTAVGATWTAAGIVTSSGTINNAFSNTVTSSGNVSISGTFSAPQNSTLIMSGSATNLNATVQIGSFIANAAGTITLTADLGLSRHLTIQTGTFASGNYDITVGGDWTNATGVITRFLPGTGSVEFTSSPVNISGPNQWYVIRYNQIGGTIRFERNRMQRILPGGLFQAISASDANRITLTRDNPLEDNQDLNWTPPAQPNPALMWQLDLQGGANIDFQFVRVWYSDARSNPVTFEIASPESNSPVRLGLATIGVIPPEIANTCFMWISGLNAIYSYTMDGNNNGKIDRIRVEAQANLDMDFSGFSVSVSGYEVNVSEGVNGFEGVAGTNVFYIHLVEKPYLDGSRTPSWEIVSNTTLRGSVFPNFILNTLVTPMVPADTVAPRIAYTLTIPSTSDTFFGFNEAVERAGGGPVDAGAMGGAINLIGLMGDGDKYGVVVTLMNRTLANIIAEIPVTVDAGITDTAAPISDWSADPFYSLFISASPSYPAGSLPNPISLTSNTHRVSDLLISVPPTPAVAGSWSAVNPDSWFVWPIWARDEGFNPGEIGDFEPLSPADTASLTVGLIRSFDGSQWLRDQDFLIQSRVSAAAPLGTPSILYDSNVARALRSEVPGIWLPPYSEADFSGLAAVPNPGSSLNASSSLGAGLWNNNFLATDPKVFDRAVFEFYYRLSGAPADLYAGRLDIAPGAPALPADWYRRVRPFGFSIRELLTQRSGVTILNNVIDPTKGERTRLNYILASAGQVTVTVFTLDGDVVQVLQRGRQNPGDYTVNWDGRNRAGNAVARGIYFIRIVAPGIDEIRKVMVVKN